MFDLVGWLETYFRSEDATWHLVCFVVSILNQIAIVRYVLSIFRKLSLGVWYVRGTFAVVVLAVDNLLIDSGYGVEVGLMSVVAFGFDAIFFGLGFDNRLCVNLHTECSLITGVVK